MLQVARKEQSQVQRNYECSPFSLEGDARSQKGRGEDGEEMSGVPELGKSLRYSAKGRTMKSVEDTNVKL